MNKDKIREFFDELAPAWDHDMVIDEKIMNLILDNAKIEEGHDVLDVACGTGVMIPFYLSRNVNSVTGVDLSVRMCEAASAKFHDERVKIVCSDIDDYNPDKTFDNIIIYNSFPHFIEPEKLIMHLTGLLKDNGYLSIAHGASRERINSCHSNISDDIKCELMKIEDLSSMMSRYLDVTAAISDDTMYQIVGRKKVD